MAEPNRAEGVQRSGTESTTVMPSFLNPRGCENFFFIEYGHVGYQKIPYLMQIQISSTTYLSDKRHLKKLWAKM
jgi:hypothetical protein